MRLASCVTHHESTTKRASSSAREQRPAQQVSHLALCRVPRFFSLHSYPLLLLFLFQSLGCDIPQDPNSTFQKVRNEVMRVGIIEQSPWATWTEDGAEGIEVRLLNEFADSCDAQIESTRGSESKLFELLKRGELDLVLGGLTTSTPWSTEVGLTQPYLKADDPITGDRAEYVWAVARGENRWLLETDSFLQARRKIAREWFKKAEL